MADYVNKCTLPPWNTNLAHGACIGLMACFQRSETDNSSPKMEKEGFVRSMAFFRSKGKAVTNLVTDRNYVIGKVVNEQFAGVTHYFDVWHFIKSKCAVYNTSQVTIT